VCLAASYESPSVAFIRPCEDRDIDLNGELQSLQGLKMTAFQRLSREGAEEGSPRHAAAEKTIWMGLGGALICHKQIIYNFGTARSILLFTASELVTSMELYSSQIFALLVLQSNGKLSYTAMEMKQEAISSKYHVYILFIT